VFTSIYKYVQIIIILPRLTNHYIRKSFYRPKKPRMPINQGFSTYRNVQIWTCQLEKNQSWKYLRAHLQKRTNQVHFFQRRRYPNPIGPSLTTSTSVDISASYEVDPLVHPQWLEWNNLINLDPKIRCTFAKAASMVVLSPDRGHRRVTGG